MFTSKSPELNINFLNQIFAPLTSAFNRRGVSRRRRAAVMSSHGALRDVADHLATAGGFQVGFNPPKWREFFFDVCFFCYCFFVGVCSRLMNDDVDISYTICLYLIYIMYIYIIFICWNIYYVFLGECIAWRNGWQCDFLSRSLTLTVDPTYIWVLDSSKETMCVGTFHHLIRISLCIY